MDYETRGKVIYKDMIIDLCPLDDQFLVETCESSLRIIIIDEGSLVLEHQGKRLFVDSPALICVNNRIALHIVKTSKKQFDTIYFKPQVINSLYKYSFLETVIYENLTQTEQQDLFWLRPFISEESTGLTYVKLGPSSLQRVKSLYQSMQSELNDQPDPFWPCRSRSIFLEFLYYLNSIMEEYEDFKVESDSSEDLFEEIRFYIHNHFHEIITLEALASQFNTNRTTLNTLFVDATGKSVIAYLIELRIKLACLILRDTTVPVKEIVYRTGFNDMTHFGRTFKKHVQLTPSQYRDNYNWMLK